MIDDAIFVTVVEDESRLKVSDIESIFAINAGNDLPDSSILKNWLLAAKQAADRYMNNPFTRYAGKVPEPVEQGVLAFVGALYEQWLLDYQAMSGGISSGGSDGSRRIVQMKVGDQSVSFSSPDGLNTPAAGYAYLQAGFGPAEMAGKQYWSQFRLFPVG